METEALSRDMSLKDYMDHLLGLAMDNNTMQLSGHVVRGGCVIHYEFSIKGIEFATAYASNPETKH